MIIRFATEKNAHLIEYITHQTLKSSSKRGLGTYTVHVVLFYFRKLSAQSEIEQCSKSSQTYSSTGIYGILNMIETIWHYVYIFKKT